jgi:hypothetical protein
MIHVFFYVGYVLCYNDHGLLVGVQYLCGDLLPKVGNIKPMNCKRIKKN